MRSHVQTTWMKNCLVQYQDLKFRKMSFWTIMVVTTGYYIVDQGSSTSFPKWSRTVGRGRFAVTKSAPAFSRYSPNHCGPLATGCFATMVSP
ncbi:hypothetical protein FKM82_017718 [Ascaphus truei]